MRLGGSSLTTKAGTLEISLKIKMVNGVSDNGDKRRLGPPSRKQEWVRGEGGEEQAVIIDGTSAELQVSVTSLLS